MVKDVYPNILFIIGNGFDLAHGMRTSYSDFLLWYLNEANKTAIQKIPAIFEDSLIKLEVKYLAENSRFDDFEGFNSSLIQNRVRIEYKNEFIEDLIKSCFGKAWVDIEYAYFRKLRNYYQKYEKHGDMYITQITRINACLDEVIAILVTYLGSLKFPGVNQRIQNTLWGAINFNTFKNACFLVFNYTDTIEYYLSHLELKRDSVINMHGKLKNQNNPIIFGYGDEIDLHYIKMEDLNENEYLRHMKSFGYFKTSNYQDLLRFLDSDDFKVCIMGHSCGLSDRVLLNTIFCHDKCKKIQIFYHDKGKGLNDFRQKTMEISRHFKPENKAEMRKKIVPMEESSSLS